MTIMLGNTPLLPVNSALNRLTLLVWGLAGCGKTVLASTMPGHKLWLQFDSEGTASIGERNDVTVADFASKPHDVVNDFVERGLYETQFDKVLADNPQFETVVFDSATSYSQKALSYGITSGKADGRGFKASLAQPGISGYGLRNRYTLGTINMLLRLTAKHNRHFAILCHEDTPAKDNDGNIVSITILLGGSLPQEVALQISEVWHMTDTGRPKERLIRIRPFGPRSPMRSRMFDMNSDGLIKWDYDQATDTGAKVGTWYQQWRDGGFKKLPLPK